MDRHKRTFLNNVIASVSDVYNIHKGGCAVFAFAVANRLRKVGVDFKIKVSDDFCLQKNLNSFRNCRSSVDWEQNEVYFGHVFLEIDGYFFDSNRIICANGEDPTYGDKVHDGELSMSQLSVLIRERNWNPRFNRQQIPKMLAQIEKCFDKHKHFLY